MITPTLIPNILKVIISIEIGLIILGGVIYIVKSIIDEHRFKKAKKTISFADYLSEEQ